MQEASAARCRRGCSGDGSFNLATIVWEEEKDKKLAFPFPFGCAIEDARDEAEKAIRNLGAEIGSISVKAAWAQCSSSSLESEEQILLPNKPLHLVWLPDGEQLHRRRLDSFTGSDDKTEMGNFDGRFVWYELATTDIEAAKAFYVSVVGWGTGDASVPGSVYSLFAAGDTPVAGLIELPAEAKRTGAPPQWTGYVGVDDVDIAAGRVKQLGGTVRVPPTDIPNISRFSVIADPQMATLVLVKRRERAQKQSAKPGTPGHVGWHELLAADWERAFAFYNQLLGWQKAGAHVNAMGTYQLFSDGTETIGGMWNSKSPLPLWFYYFNVGDIEAAAKRVEASGGEIFYGPIAVPGGARVVHCRDPQGALFALIDWRVRITIGCYSPSRRRPA